MKSHIIRLDWVSLWISLLNHAHRNFSISITMISSRCAGTKAKHPYSQGKWVQNQQSINGTKTVILFKNTKVPKKVYLRSVSMKSISQRQLWMMTITLLCFSCLQENKFVQKRVGDSLLLG